MLGTNKTEDLDIDRLLFDVENPRLVEFGITDESTQDEIGDVLYYQMGASELVLSIASSGFWKYEPLIVLPRDDDYIVLEGNRRLAAIKVLTRELADIPLPRGVEPPKGDALEKLATVPCLIADSRESVWQFVGFKHVNGPAKWGSYAKAKYISEIHNKFGVSIKDIAFQIGDTNKTAQKLYQGWMVIQQAIKENVFDLGDLPAPRLFFSHLYTGLQRNGIREFLQLEDAEVESKTPVREDRVDELEQLLLWMYGSKSKEVKPIIQSQNPDLKHLDEVLQSREALAALRSNETLIYSHEIAQGSNQVFEENLMAAKRALQKAKSFSSEAYHGDVDLFYVSRDIRNIATDLYEEMK